MKKISEIARDAAASVPTPTLPQKIPLPEFPVGTDPLGPADQWRSIVWHIDTAEADGKEALFALAMAFGKTIQSTALQDLLTDVRDKPRPALDFDTLLWETPAPITENGDTLDSVRLGSRTQVTVSFQEAVLIANPWVPFRLTRSLGNIGRQEWRKSSMRPLPST
ncbi:hypothetical protein LGN17_28230 [Burkholderia sp. AU30280]|uniref:hypothetical protein n=1 Tax=Burkholderia sp. AU30280 TaxID=2879628 RepID=UPI001CF58E40|nr:hypothetical protein [Burkholderia sp. AU30280]MCA8276377.1 hypothetical protein [Burkholderia sp. AU30280]